jgi:hypothetical protein
MPKWKDKKKKFDNPEIDSSEIKLGLFRLFVHRHIHYPPDTWLASCGYLFSQIELASKDLEQAKIQAVAKVHVILEDALADILAKV